MERVGLRIPLFVLIRPRPGDFLYDTLEAEVMLRDIETCVRLGCDGIVVGALDADGDLLDFDMAEVRVSRAIAGLARRAYLVTDISKLERSAPVRIISMQDLDTVFVDKPLPVPLTQKCAEWDTRVIVAD